MVAGKCSIIDGKGTATPTVTLEGVDQVGLVKTGDATVNIKTLTGCKEGVAGVCTGTELLLGRPVEVKLPESDKPRDIYIGGILDDSCKIPGPDKPKNSAYFSVDVVGAWHMGIGSGVINVEDSEMSDIVDASPGLITPQTIPHYKTAGYMIAASLVPGSDIPYVGEVTKYFTLGPRFVFLQRDTTLVNEIDGVNSTASETATFVSGVFRVQAPGIFMLQYSYGTGTADLVAESTLSGGSGLFTNLPGFAADNPERRSQPVGLSGADDSTAHVSLHTFEAWGKIPASKDLGIYILLGGGIFRVEYDRGDSQNPKIPYSMDMSGLTGTEVPDMRELSLHNPFEWFVGAGAQLELKVF